MFPWLWTRRTLRDPRLCAVHAPAVLASACGVAMPLPASARLALHHLVRQWGSWQKAIEHWLFSMGDAYETEMLAHEFQNANIADVGDATGLRGSSTAGSFYVGLHTSNPGETGNQSTGEANFTGYARQAVARSTAGWTVSGNQVSNAAAITFAKNTGSDQTITHFSIGTLSSGSGKLVRYGPLIATNAVWRPFTGDPTSDNLTIPGHDFAVDNRIVLAQAYDGSLPGGVTGGTVYWVKTVSGNNLQISATQGGAAIDLTSAGSGVAIKAQPITVRGGIDAVQFPAGALVCKID